MNGVTLPIDPLETNQPEDIGACEMPRRFSNKLHSKTQVSSRLGMSGVDPLEMPRTPYRAGKGKHSQ